MLDGHEHKSHPSYALVQLSRRSSSHGRALFGSSIGHANTITLTICRGEEVRSTDLSYDHYFAREQLIEVEMSQTQFAEMITSMNYGSGVPATIRQYGREKPEDPPVENKRAQHSKEFKQKMMKFAETLKEGQAELQRLVKKQKLSAEDKRRMTFLFNHLTNNITANFSFFEEQFEEQLDKTVAEAKGEVDAFITNAVQKTGLEALQKEGKMLGLEQNKE